MSLLDESKGWRDNPKRSVYALPSVYGKIPETKSKSVEQFLPSAQLGSELVKILGVEGASKLVSQLKVQAKRG